MFVVCLNSRSLLTGLDENYMFCAIVTNVVATGHLKPGGFPSSGAVKALRMKSAWCACRLCWNLWALAEWMMDFIGEQRDLNLKVILWLSYVSY